VESPSNQYGQEDWNAGKMRGSKLCCSPIEDKLDAYIKPKKELYLTCNLEGLED
jgi:hypothetical protein